MKSTRLIKNKILNMACISLTAVIITICSWISIPATIPFTLQTFAVFLANATLGGKRAAAAAAIYILLGAVGIPVFSNFKGGLPAIAGPTGGYITGFIIMSLLYWLITSIAGHKPVVKATALVLGLLSLYAFGTGWFIVTYNAAGGAPGPVNLSTALSWCVFPFIIPDLVKLTLAVIISEKILKHIKIPNPGGH